MDVINAITDWENGNLDLTDTVNLFSYLIRTGTINSLQSSYQRTARALIEHGLIDPVDFLPARVEEF